MKSAAKKKRDLLAIILITTLCILVTTIAIFGIGDLSRSAYDAGDGIAISYQDGGTNAWQAAAGDVATVTYDSNGDGTIDTAETTGYGMFSDAWKAAMDITTSADNRAMVTLFGDVTATGGSFGIDATYGYIPIKDGDFITLDLNGFVIDRGLTTAIAQGCVINVIGPGNLEIADSGSTSTHTGSYSEYPLGGVITGGNNSSFGGGICVTYGGDLAIEGGTIYQNKAAGGGAVNISGSSKDPSALDIVKCDIRNNEATNASSSGGGILASNYVTGTIGANVNIFLNSSVGNGGGISISATNDPTAAKVTLRGKVYGNTSSSNTGVVKIFGELTVDGGEIFGNNSSASGSVYLAGGKLILSGAARIEDNFIGGTLNGDRYVQGSGTEANVYLQSGQMIEFDNAKPFTGTVGVTTEAEPAKGSPVTATSGYGASGSTGTILGDSTTSGVKDLGADSALEKAMAVAYTVRYNRISNSLLWWGDTLQIDYPDDKKVEGVDLVLPTLIIDSKYECNNTGYMFYGWTKGAESIAGGEEMRVYTEDASVTLNQIWGGYLVTYKPGNAPGRVTPDFTNSVVGVEKTVESEVPLGLHFTFTKYFFTSERNGMTGKYEQIGWSDVENWAMDDGGEALTDGTFYDDTYAYDNWLPELQNHLVLYPVWGERTEVTTIYKPGTSPSGDGITGGEIEKRHNYDASFTLDGVSFYLSDYVQTGWTKTDSGTTKDYALSQNLVVFNDDLVLYPYWETAPAATVRFDANGNGTIDADETTGYVTFAEAWKAAMECATTVNKYATVQLHSDVTAVDGSFGIDATYGYIPVLAGDYIALDLNGYVIDRGLTTVTSVGHVIYVNNGSLDITDSNPNGSHTGSYDGYPVGGVVTGGYAQPTGSDRGGGGIYAKLDSGDSLKINGGTIYKNKSGLWDYNNIRGAGIAIEGNGGTVLMDNCAVRENAMIGTGSSFGGGVYLSGNVDCIIGSGAKIFANNASAGAGLFIYDATVTIKGQIYGNDAKTSSVDVHGTLIVDGGEITGNNMTSERTIDAYSATLPSCGSVNLESGTLTLKNGATIDGNFCKGTYNAASGKFEAGTKEIFANVYLCDGTVLEFEGFTGRVGVMTKTIPTNGNPVTVTSGYGAGNVSGTVTADPQKLYPLFSVGDELAVGVAAATVAFNNATEIYATFADAWKAALACATSADNRAMVQLLADVVAVSGSFGIDTTYGYIPVGQGDNIVFDLNGYLVDRGLTTETADGSVIIIAQGGELEIIDLNPLRTHEGSYGAYPEGGVMTGGNSTGSGGGIYANLSEGCKLTIRGGTIYKNKSRISGGGIYVSGNGGTVLLEKGVALENEAAGEMGGKGGGICLYKCITCTIGGGFSILRNTAQNGGGLALSAGTDATAAKATLQGVLSGNNATQNGGGVSVFGQLTLDGGQITGNNALTFGGGVYFNNGTVTVKNTGNVIGNFKGGTLNAASGQYEIGAGAKSNLYLSKERVVGFEAGNVFSGEVGISWDGALSVENPFVVITSGYTNGTLSIDSNPNDIYNLVYSGAESELIVQLVTYTVTYHKGVHSETVTGDEVTETLVKGEAYTFKGKIFDSARFEQTGWKNDNGDEYGLESWFYINKDLDLYPVWTQDKVTVKYHLGSGAGTLPDSIDVAINTTYTISETLGLNYQSYTHIFWKRDAESFVEEIYNNVVYVSGTADVDLYPVWAALTYKTDYNGTVVGSEYYAVTGFAEGYLYGLDAAAKQNLTIDIPAEYNDGIHGKKPVKHIGSAAFKSTNIPNDCTVTGLNLSNAANLTNIFPEAFSGQSSIVTSNGLKIPDKVTSIGVETFADCSGISGALTLPEKLDSIDMEAFLNCSGLTGTLELGTVLLQIGSNAFSGCTGLSGAVTIPASVIIIGNFAFGGDATYADCGIRTFHLESDPSNFINLSSKQRFPSAAYIAVPQAYYSAYQTKITNATDKAHLTYIAVIQFVEDETAQYGIIISEQEKCAGQSIQLGYDLDTKVISMPTEEWEIPVPDARTGWNFLGFQTVKESGTFDVSKTMTVPVNTERINQIFYGAWALKTYTVTYSSGGESGVTGNLPDAGIKTHGTPYAVSESYPLHKDGYRQVGWRLPDEWNAISIYSTEDSVTLYPVWDMLIFTTTFENGKYTITGFSDVYFEDVVINYKQNIVLVIPYEYDDGYNGRAPVAAIDTADKQGAFHAGQGYMIKSLTFDAPENYDENYKITIGERSFYGQTKLNGTASNAGGDTVLRLPTTVVTVAKEAFYGCSAITELQCVVITDIGEKAFEGCTSLKSAELGIGFGTDRATFTIGRAAFAGCAALTEVEFGGIQAYTWYIIGDYAFTGCTNESFRSVTLRCAKSIGNGAFAAATVDDAAYGDCSASLFRMGSEIDENVITFGDGGSERIFPENSYLVVSNGIYDVIAAKLKNATDQANLTHKVIVDLSDGVTTISSSVHFAKHDFHIAFSDGNAVYDPYAAFTEPSAREGFVFVGYSTEQDGTSPNITPYTKFAVNPNFDYVRLYAVYKEEAASLFDAKFIESQVWDCQRSPAFPIEGRYFEVSGLRGAYDDQLNEITWATGDYVQFETTGKTLGELSLRNIEAIIRSLINYTGASEADLRAALVVEEVWYSHDGTKKGTLSSVGLVWALGEKGFLYTALGGKLQNSGGVGTFVSAVPHAAGDVIGYVPPNPNPYKDGDQQPPFIVIGDWPEPEPTATFGGKVVTNDGTACVGVTVTVNYNGGSYYAVTDTLGNFIIDEVTYNKAVTAYSVTLKKDPQAKVFYRNKHIAVRGLGNSEADRNPGAVNEVYVYDPDSTTEGGYFTHQVTLTAENGSITDGTRTITVSDGATVTTDGESIYIDGVKYNATANADTDQYKYAFVGWTGVLSPILGDVTVKATYSETLKSYTFSFSGGVEEGVTGNDPADITQEYGTKVTLPGETYYRQGYEQDGWQCGDDIGYVLGAKITVDGPMSFVPIWIPNTNTAYKVEHILQDLDGNYTITDQIQSFTNGTTGATVTAVEKTIVGFTAKADNVLTGTVLADGSLVVTVKYTRNSYTLTWNANEGILSGAYTSGSVKYEAPLTAPTATREGYRFDKWNKTVPATMPADNLSFTAQWIKVGTIFDAEFYKPQVWDCFRSPAFPVKDRAFKISNLSDAYDKDMNKVPWADGDYIKFESCGYNVSDIVNQEDKNRIINSLSQYSGSNTMGIENAIVVREILYNSDGVVKKVLSNLGLVWSLDEKGFLYTALDGEFPWQGGIGTFVSFAAHNNGDVVIIIPDSPDPLPIGKIIPDDKPSKGDPTPPAEAKISIGGKVVDNNGTALPNIIVSLTYGTETKTATTDPKGNFLFDGILYVTGTDVFSLTLTDGTHDVVKYQNKAIISDYDVYVYNLTSTGEEVPGENLTHTVTISVSGGEYGSVSANTIEVPDGTFLIVDVDNGLIAGTEKVTVATTENSAQFTYTCAGWSQIRNPVNQDLTIQVVFIQTENTFTVKYYENFDKSGTTHTATKKYDVAFTLNGLTFTKTGYQQVGWTTAETGGTQYALSASYTANADLELYPVWKQIRTVSYLKGNDYGGTVTGTEHTLDIAVDATSVTLPDRNVDASYCFGRPDYAQIGWTTALTGGTVYDFGATVAFAQDKDLTFYPVWEQRYFAITFDNGSLTTVLDGTMPTGQKKMKGQAFHVYAANTPLLTAVYTQIGWGLAESFDGTGRLTEYTVDAEVTLYPIWKELVYDSEYDSEAQSYEIRGFTYGYLHNPATDVQNLKIEIPAEYDDGIHGKFPVNIIGAFAFYLLNGMDERYDGCRFTELDLSKATNLKEIDLYAFGGCGDLSGILEIPDSVTTIAPAAFICCSGFTGLRLPANLEKLGSYAFTGCVNMRGSVHFTTAIQDQDGGLYSDSFTEYSSGTTTFGACGITTYYLDALTALPRIFAKSGDTITAIFPQNAYVIVNKNTYTLFQNSTLHADDKDKLTYAVGVNFKKNNNTILATQQKLFGHNFQTGCDGVNAVTVDGGYLFPTQTMTGYTLAGYNTASGQSAVNITVDTVVTAAMLNAGGGLDLYPVWQANENTIYTVKHVKENLDGTFSEDEESRVTAQGTTGTRVTAATKTYLGFGLDPANVLSDTIVADGSLVITVKYLRNVHTLTWDADGGTLSGNYTSGSVKYGAPITAPTASYERHIFDGWSATVATTMPDDNLTYKAKWTALVSIFDMKYYEPQVWDCFRSPAFPVANRNFRISGLSTAYDKDMNRVPWEKGNGDYIKFVSAGTDVYGLTDAAMREHIIKSLQNYTGCSEQAIGDALVVREILYHANGNEKKVLSNVGLVWALGDKGFLYTALDGSFPWQGGIGTYVSFQAHTPEEIIVYIPDQPDPYKEEDIVPGVVPPWVDPPVPGPTSVAVGGKVVDSNGIELKDILVTVIYDSVTYSATTDADGNFVIDGIPFAAGVFQYKVKLKDATHDSAVYEKSFADKGFGSENGEIRYNATDDVYVYAYSTTGEEIPGGYLTHTVTVSVASNSVGYGTAIGSIIVRDGSLIIVSGAKLLVGGTEVIATPTASDGQYLYSFEKWNNVLNPVTGDLTITAEFKREKKTYTITWKNNDDTVIGTSAIAFGIMPEYSGTEPTMKNGDTHYTYSFAGWTPILVDVSGDASYKATFDRTAKPYTVTFAASGESDVTGNGEVKTVPYNDTIDLSEITLFIRVGYTQTGWKNSSGTEFALNATYTVTGAATLYPVWSPKTDTKYTVKHVLEDLDGNYTISNEVQNFTGTTGATVAATVKIIEGFSVKTDNVLTGTVASDGSLVITVKYVRKMFTITWKLGDGTLETDENVKYGARPTYEGQAPTKSETEQFIYAFNGWSNDKDAETGVPADQLGVVTETAVYYALFTERVKSIDAANPDPGDDPSGNISGGAESEDGFEANTTLVIKVISKTSAEASLTLPDGKTFLNTYNATMLVNGIVTPPSGEITIKFAKPASLAEADTYTIIIVENGVTVTKTATVQGDYLKFTTPVLGDFAIIADNPQGEEDTVVDLLWLIILLAVLVCLELVAVGVLIGRNRRDKKSANGSDDNDGSSESGEKDKNSASADDDKEKNKKSNRKKSKSVKTNAVVPVFPLIMAAVSFKTNQTIAAAVLGAAALVLVGVIIYLALKSYRAKRALLPEDDDVYGDAEGGETEEVKGDDLKVIIAAAAETAVVKTEINKRTIADFLVNRFRDSVVVNRRANYTSTGLPLADTHYTADGSKKVCFTYVYEFDSGKVFLLLKTDKETVRKIKKRHPKISPSRFPKSKWQWYSLIIDDTFRDGKDLFDILAEIVEKNK